MVLCDWFGKGEPKGMESVGTVKQSIDSTHLSGADKLTILQHHE